MARYVDPAFEMGMALGNAYGNMWTANAKKRQEEKAERIISDMMGGNVTSEDVNAAITSGTGVLDQMKGVTGQDVKAAINGWPVGLTADAMRDNLRKNNINQEVIDKVMARPEQQMRDAMTAKYLPQILEGVYGKDSKLGSAVEQIIKMGEYDPKLSNWLLSSIPTAKDVYNQEGRMAIKGMGLGPLKGADGIGQPNASWFNAIASEIKALEAEEALHGELSRDKKAQLAGLRAVYKSIIPPVYDASTGASTNSPTDGKEKGAWDTITDYVSDLFGSDKPAVSESYGKSINEWQNALARNQKAGEDVRWSKQQLIDYAKKKYGADADAIIGATDWKAFGF